jgi:hypothetical protein
MGPEYIFQKPFDMAASFEETSNNTPMFFVLFPGVDPTPWVETLGKRCVLRVPVHQLPWTAPDMSVLVCVCDLAAWASRATRTPS